MKRERPVAVIRRQSSNDGCVHIAAVSAWIGQCLLPQLVAANKTPAQ